MKRKDTNKKSRLKKVLISIIILIVCVGLMILGLALFGQYQMSKIPALSFREALEYTTKDNENAVITVGVIKDGEASFTVYEENGAELPKELHTYEIGSLTKTFTAAMISKAVQEGKLELDASIDRYLVLPEGNTYPTIKELVTHTSGYKGYYFESPMISNFFKGRNDFYGITKDMILNKAGEISLPEESKFNYSNFGYAVLGLVLEAVYEQDYTTLMNSFVQNELMLTGTQISDQSGDLGKYWDWKAEDAYISAGALTSNIEDMLTYARLQLEAYEYLADCHESIKEINASNGQYKMMGINMDEIGMAWIIDKENGIIWHNGGTEDYNSYLGFIPEKGVAVVVLSNLSPSYRIPATVLGIKVLHELEK